VFTVSLHRHEFQNPNPFSDHDLELLFMVINRKVYRKRRRARSNNYRRNQMKKILGLVLLLALLTATLMPVDAAATTGTIQVTVRGLLLNELKKGTTVWLDWDNSLVPRSAKTNSNGVATFTNVAKGAHKVKACNGVSFFCGKAVSVSVSAGKTSSVTCKV
jgi:hypothetical protein